MTPPTLRQMSEEMKRLRQLNKRQIASYHILTALLFGILLGVLLLAALLKLF